MAIAVHPRHLTDGSWQREAAKVCQSCDRECARRGVVCERQVAATAPPEPR